MRRNHIREFLRGMDAELLVDIHSAKNNRDRFGTHPEFWSQKPHHVIGSLSCNGGRSNTDFELKAFGLANGIALGTRRSEYIEYQGFAIPCAEGLQCETRDFGRACGHHAENKKYSCPSSFHQGKRDKTCELGPLPTPTRAAAAPRCGCHWTVAIRSSTGPVAIAADAAAMSAGHAQPDRTPGRTQAVR